MDQVKVILKVLQKHHFWLLCLIILLTSIGGWWSARNALSAAYVQKKQAIVGKFSTMETLRSSESHPNATWKQGIDQLTEQEKKTVGSTWEKIYNEQKQLLEWPPELGEKFLKFVNSSPPDAPFSPDLLDIYQRRIPDEYPRLLKIIGAHPPNDPIRPAAGPGQPTPPAPPGRPAAAPPAAVAAETTEPAVIWSAGSQRALKDSLEFQVRPTSAQVRQVQEDLWVYRALLRIIKAVNQGHYTAKVKQIASIEIGKEAAAAFADGMGSGHIERLAAAPSGGAGGGAPPLPPPADAAAAPKSPDDGRYVDADGKPLAGGTAGAQFKRVPVFLKLTIDQREIPKLLVECANSPLPVEIRQLRVNPSHSGKGGKPEIGQAPPGRTPAAGEGPDPFEVPIEVHGIIYIYNKPDVTKVGAAALGGAPAAVSE